MCVIMMCNVSNLNYGKRKGEDLENSTIKKGCLQGRNFSIFSQIPLEILQKIFTFLPWKSAISFSISESYVNETFSRLYKNFIVYDLREKCENSIPSTLLQKCVNLSISQTHVEIADYLSSEFSLQKIRELSINDEKFKKIVEVANLMLNLKTCFVKRRKFFGIPECFMLAVSSGKVEELNFMILWYLDRCNTNQELNDLDEAHIFASQATANLQEFFLFLINSDRISILANILKTIGKNLMSHPALCNQVSLPLWLTTLIKSYKEKEKIEEYLEKKTTLDDFDDFLKGALCIYEFTTYRLMKSNEDPSLNGGDCLNQNLERISNPLQNINGENEIEVFFKKIDYMEFSFDFQIKLKKCILKLRYPEYPNFEFSEKIEILVEAVKEWIPELTFQSLMDQLLNN